MSILKVDHDGMKQHAHNLGVEGRMWGLFACMVTGRPWETVQSGVDKVQQTKTEKDIMQVQGSLVLPQISDVLEQVDRQMLLVLKTNDLIRGIETTLQTQNRMTAFWVMSKCCIKSIRDLEYSQASSRWQRISTSISKHFSILLMNLYYLYRGLINFDLFSTVKMLL
jgi:aarF domain-containing kinase